MAGCVRRSKAEGTPGALRLRLLVLIAAMVQSVCTDSGVLIRSKYGQSLTSSTLQWISIDRDVSAATTMPENAIEAGQEGTTTTFVCRTYHSGISLIGSSDGNSCSVVFYDAIYSYGRFDVLVNPDGAARLLWVSWDRSKTIPMGTVENGGHYVARRKDSANVYVGRLDPNDLRGKLYVAEAAIVREFTDGELLVEVEAVAYEVSRFDWNYTKQRLVSSTTITLAETLLTNLESERESVISMAFPVLVNRSWYLRPAHGVDKTIPVLLQLPEVSERPSQLFWGRKTEFPETNFEEVSRKVPFGSAVNVTATATRVTYEAPYTANLKTVYSDGKFFERDIEGTAQQTLIKDLKITYGDAYVLSDGSAVLVTTKPGITTSATWPGIKEHSEKDKFFILDTEQQLDEPRDDFWGRGTTTSTTADRVSIAKEAKNAEAAAPSHSSACNNLQQFSLLLPTLCFVVCLSPFF